MTSQSIFENFVSSQGYALFESAGEGEFRLIGEWPAWCRAMWGAEAKGNTSIRLGDKSSFLDNFLYDAEEFWKSGKPGSVASGNWIEADETGGSTPLEASALSLDGKRILIIRNLSSTFAEQQEWFQTARDSLLSHERLLREILKKEILLHCIVHDLSQPLSAMRGCFHLLSLEPLSPTLKKYVKSGERESQRQEMMIRGILEAFSTDLAAQQTVNKEHTDAPDLAACAKQAVEAFETAFRDRGVKLRVDPAVKLSANWRVIGEASRLDRIFGNLLENAMRYSPKGSTVTINLQDQSEFVLASVNDEGPGLPADMPQNQLFALFARGKSHAGKAGLGLYFCKITVERWGGAIGAENRAEGGSRFWFRLPRAAADAKLESAAQKSEPAKHAAAKHPAHPKPAKALHILVADDAELNRELVIELLERRGYTAVGVPDGKKALAALEHGHFDAVLMDEEMPHMTGVEATRAIREREAGGSKHQFIIGITGNAAFEDERRLLEAGMDAFLTKPVHMQKLYQTVELAAHRSAPSAAHDPQDADASSAASVTPATPPAPVLAPNLIVGAVAATASAETEKAVAVAVDLRAHLSQITGGNEKLARSLVKTFLADAPKTLEQIRKAVAKKNARKLGSTAHLLKGSIAIFGAAKAVAAAQSLQNMGRSGHVRSAAELRTLESEFKSLDRELRALYPPEPAKPPKAGASKSKSRKKR